MSKETAQLNVRLPKELAARIRMDSARNSVSVENVSRVILEEWFQSFTVAERAKQYEKHAEKKMTGRPIKGA